jgi:hypothetical protein
MADVLATPRPNEGGVASETQLLQPAQSDARTHRTPKALRAKSMAGPTAWAVSRAGAPDKKLNRRKNEDNEGFLLRNPNWIFVFVVAFCKNLFGYDQSDARTHRTPKALRAKSVAGPTVWAAAWDDPSALTKTSASASVWVLK